MITQQTIQPYISPNSTIIVGFSGGPDSVCLLTLLHKLAPTLNLKIIAAHLDHQWRKESGKDADWCEKFCNDHNIIFESKNATELNFNIKYNGSKEELGRKLRRLFFEEIAKKYHAEKIALAHHGDDQLETFFIRMARGSSIAGLSGIKIFDGLYVRPLLHVSKQEILNYLSHHKIDFLTDATNTDPKYLRNRIRHTLLPQLTQIDHRFHENIKNSMIHFQKTDAFLHQTMLKVVQKISNTNFDKCLDQGSKAEMTKTGIHIPSFLQLHEIMQHRILMHLFIQNNITLIPSTALFEELLRFLKTGKNSSHKLHPTLGIFKQTDHFYFKSL
ncbi:tRNA lysidine(34) synthetase TilS [Candidatus Babeliales bacterium]|nr:tRNA lysidine(34) synthetase TilS [Candidatus Babeliales bacterium]